MLSSPKASASTTHSCADWGSLPETSTGWFCSSSSCITCSAFSLPLSSHQQRVGGNRALGVQHPFPAGELPRRVGLKADGGNQLDIIKTGLVKVQLGAADHDVAG